MNREDIIRMAQECDLIGLRPHLDGFYVECVERFAALVAAVEREACAKACERRGMVKGGEVFAARIRARGQA